MFNDMYFPKLIKTSFNQASFFFLAQQCKNHTCSHCSCCHLVSLFNTHSKQHFIWNANCKNILIMQNDAFSNTCAVPEVHAMYQLPNSICQHVDLLNLFSLWILLWINVFCESTIFEETLNWIWNTCTPETSCRTVARREIGLKDSVWMDL